jgi:Fic family protein
MKKIKNPPRLSFFEDPDEFKDTMLLQADGEIQDYVYRLNKKYVHWDEMRHYSHPKNAPSELIWNLIKLFRLPQYHKVKIGDTMFRYVVTDEIYKQLHLLDQQTSGTLESKSNYLVAPEQVEKYLINSIMEEAIASSQLEGAMTTREVAKEMLRTGKKPKDESQQMILNAYQTMLFLKDIKDEELTPELICRIQGKMTENTIEDKFVGKFRDNNEIHVVDSATGESIHVPPDHKRIMSYIKSLCKFANSESKEFLHPTLKAIILHFMIGYVHPFEDGNGRTARALFYWYTLKNGYWLLEFMPISRVIKRAPARYSRAYLYTESDENDLSYFIVFNLRQIKIALNEFVDYVKQKREETEQVKKILQKDERLNFRQSDMVLRFIRHPLKKFSINEIKKIYNVAYETARSDLDHLHYLKYCEKTKEGRKYVYTNVKSG